MLHRVLAPADNSINTNDVVVLVDDLVRRDATLGTRLAARHPQVTIFAWDPSVEVAERAPVVGRLHSFALTLELLGGVEPDVWSRAARLIHERYRIAYPGDQDSRKPWSQLDKFYKGSNYRQVKMALWMVEVMGDHTLSAFDGTVPGIKRRSGGTPIERLAALGFDEPAAMEMAKAEHEDWCRYYEDADWSFGVERDEKAKKNENLVPWKEVLDSRKRQDRALDSVAGTLEALRDLGYRSRPHVWSWYRNVGEVTAVRQKETWTWTSGTGALMEGMAGDWDVTDPASGRRSADDAAFHKNYQQIDDKRWRGNSDVEARRARTGEAIKLHCGIERAAEGSWVIRGADRERWIVPGDLFESAFIGPIAPDARRRARNDGSLGL
ncbi:hypothetical protein SMNI109538_06340 [Smaragdicoccus niigatensis]